MQVELIDASALHQDPANVRVHPDRNVQEVAASLARFGQQKPIVVDQSNVVVAGNATLQAAISLGWESVAIVRTPLEGSDRTAYAIADNRTAELALWSDADLAAQLASLDTLEGVGFTQDELDALTAESEREGTEGAGAEHGGFICPSCGYRE